MQDLSENTTKQRILECAANLFAEKGFTETTTRELAKAVGVKNPASLYFHFPSKLAILEHMLKDYTKYNTDVFEQKNIPETLRNNPNTDGILACYQTAFPPDRVEYYLKVLCVMLQEQLRNPVVQSYMSESLILRSERNTVTVIDALKELGLIRKDTDPDYWKKAVSSLFYSFATRMMLGIGDNTPEFKGRGMEEMLKCTFDILLKQYGTTEAESERSKEADG